MDVGPSFSVAGPTTWNSLPKHWRDPVHTTWRLRTTFFSFQSTSIHIHSALGTDFGVDAPNKFTFYLLIYYRLDSQGQGLDLRH